MGLPALAVVTLAFPTASASLISYEGTSFPEEEGWDREETLFPAQRWLDEGWFFQHPEVVNPDPPHEGEEDFYRRSLAEFVGQGAMVVEWRLETDGPREEIVGAAPVVLSMAGQLGVFYHFTIARDQVRFVQGGELLPTVWVDIEPDVPHAYRLEIHGDTWYEWTIDGMVIDAGVPEGMYPTSDSFLIWGANAILEDSVSRWDYIRIWTIPEPATGLLLVFGAGVLGAARRMFA